MARHFFTRSYFTPRTARRTSETRRLQIEELESRLMMTATRLAFVGQLPDVALGQTLDAVQVQVLDENNQPDTTSTAPITLAVGNAPGASMLQGTVTVPAVGGVATFRDVFLFGGQPASGYTFLASSGNLDAAESNTFAVNAGAVRLQFLSQPANVAAGESLGSVTVRVLKSDGSVDTADDTTNVTVYLNNNPGNATLRGITTQRVSKGQATFSGLSLDKIGVGYTLGAQVTDIHGIADPLLTRATSASFSIHAAAASGLAFGIQPGYNAVNQHLNGTNAPAGVTVRVVDRFGNLVSTSTASVTVALNHNPGNATLSGTTTVAAVNGVATFSTLKIDRAATEYSLEAHLTDAPAESVVSAKFNVGAQAPQTLTFQNLPTAAVGLDTIVPAFRVEVRGADGQLLSTDSTTRVTLSISNPPGVGGYVVGTLTATAVNGIATFSDLIFKGAPIPASTVPGQIATISTRLMARFAESTNPTSVLSDLIKIKHGPAVRLNFVDAAMTDAEAGSPLKTVQVRVVDAQNNVVDDGPDSTAKLLLAVHQSTPNLKATFLYDLNLEPDPAKAKPELYIARNAVAGVATFANIAINRVSVNYLLTAGSQSFFVQNEPLTSPFAVKVGAPSQLAYTSQPLDTAADQTLNGNVSISLLDRVGNLVTSDNSTQVTLELVPGGTLKGRNVLTAFGGVVAVRELGVAPQAGVPGPWKLKASATVPDGNGGQKVIEVVSNTFQVNNPSAQPLPTSVTFDTEPPLTVNANTPFEFKVRLAGIPSNQGAYTVTAYLETPYSPTTTVLTGPLTVVAQGEIATFSGMGLTQPGTFKIRVVSNIGVMGQTSRGITVPPPQLLQGAGGGGGEEAALTAPDGVVQVGLGSYANNYDYLKTFTTYGQNPIGQTLPTNTPLPGHAVELVHPTVTPNFQQPVQTSDWWSSLIFRRQAVAPGDDKTQDPNGLELWPTHPFPFSVLASTGGLGMAYLAGKNDPFTVIPVAEFKDGNPPATQIDPRYPGNLQFQYDYSDTNFDPAVNPPPQKNNDHLFQDISVGLAGLNADPLPLAYSDWTVTLDWGGKFQATLGEGMPFAYYRAPQGGTFQITTSDPYKKVTVKAFNASGQEVATGQTASGPLRLQVSYSVLVVDPLSTQPAPNNMRTITLNNSYGVFLPSDVTWSVDANGTLTANLGADGTKGYASVAVLPDATQTTFDFYRARAYAFVTGSTSSFTYDEGTAAITTSYALKTDTAPMLRETSHGVTGLLDRPLQALFQHQYRFLPAGTPLTPYTYDSARGEMKVFDGKVFVTRLTHQGVLPFVPDISGANAITGDTTNPYHAALWRTYLYPFLASVSSAPVVDGRLLLDQLVGGSDVYNQGQSMMAAAQLVPLLLQIGRSTELTTTERATVNQAAESILNRVKDIMGAWLSAKDDQVFQLLYYQPKTPLEAGTPQGTKGWQALLGLLGALGSNESINDQHLGYGYFLKTAAILATYDRNWSDANKLGDIVNLVVQNVSSYSRDPNSAYPFLRNFDVYAGHSWADGAANNPLGNNQESTSEALNYASGLIQWGEASGNTYLRDLGIYLFNTEAQSFHLYWYNTLNTDAFPELFTTIQLNGQPVDNRPMVTQVYGAGGQYTTFFAAETTTQVGIQTLPLSGATYYLLGTQGTLAERKAFIDRNVAQALQGIDPATGLFRGAYLHGLVPPESEQYVREVLAYSALSDPQTALTTYVSHLRTMARVNPGNNLNVDGYYLHWMNVLNEYGSVDTSVTADTASFAVYIKDPNNPATRTFVAYNPGALERDVKFTDANGVVVATLKVPGRSMATSTGLVDTAPDLSVETPLNALFLSNKPGQGAAFLSGTTGLGENSIDIPAANVPSNKPIINPPDVGALTFTQTGLYGALDPTQQVRFALWVDSVKLTAGQDTPAVGLEITYDPFGNGTDVVRQLYNYQPTSRMTGYTPMTSTTTGTNGPAVALPAMFQNGKITLKVWAAIGQTPIRLRTDAAGEQGRVSFLSVPYQFATHLKSDAPVVPPVSAALGSSSNLPPTIQRARLVRSTAPQSVVTGVNLQFSVPVVVPARAIRLVLLKNGKPARDFTSWVRIQTFVVNGQMRVRVNFRSRRFEGRLPRGRYALLLPNELIRDAVTGVPLGLPGDDGVTEVFFANRG